MVRESLDVNIGPDQQARVLGVWRTYYQAFAASYLLGLELLALLILAVLRESKAAELDRSLSGVRFSRAKELISRAAIASV